MEKIISINFQGRVIPIEETAYNNLKQYIDSLRSHFANEESSDEIINDIENRIAELLTDRLKHGEPCIMSSDVNTVIDSIGRLEDIEAAENEEAKEQPRGNPQPASAPVSKGRFFRNEDDKVIAGVCSGIANRMGIDPVIVRVIFVVLFGAFFWVYILLWVIVPSQSVQASITRRLYRNPDDKIVAGVCGGLGAYFGMSSRTMRMIFLAPFILSMLTGVFHAMWWHWGMGFGPRIVFGSLGSTFFIGYIILWIALPYASSAADKLEMRGEKVDMNSIKAATQARGGTPAPTRHRSGLGHIIGILFKAFFLFIAGSIAVSLFAALIGLLFGGVALMPYTDFFLDSKGQYTIAWIGVVLVLGIPLLAFITWGVRRLTGARSQRHYLGYVFAVLWIAGLVSTITLAASLIQNFSSRYEQEEVYTMIQPTGNKLYVNVTNDPIPGQGKYNLGWYQDEDGEPPFRVVNNEWMWLNTVRVKVAQSPDSQFHIYKLTSSRGTTQDQAKTMAAHIDFKINQMDSIITLPKGFTISNKDKFRNQQVKIVVEVPVGNSIQLDSKIDRYEWFTVNVNRHHNRMHVSHHRHHMHHRHYNNKENRDYVMTASGLKNTEGSSTESTDDNDWDDDDEN